LLHLSMSHRFVLPPPPAELRLALPFAARGDISLKKIGLELIVRVDGQKRTLMLPPALGDYRPAGAEFEDGALKVHFDGPDRAHAE
jgi:arsenite/tail-anchored protein-transporting ATPase